MDIRHLRYFMAVAEELHFGRAASRLYMSRPPLSKRITDLEDELGVQLFTRTNRAVQLTSHGRKLLPLARETLRAFDATVEAMALPAGVDQTLRAAFVSTTSPEVLRTLRARLAAAHINLDWSEASTADQHKDLLVGRIDLGLLCLPIDTQGLWVSPPLRKVFGVATSPEHPLAGEQPIRLADLTGQTLLMTSRSAAPGLYDHILATCRENGFRPHKVKQCEKGRRALMVESGLSSGHAITFISRTDAGRLGRVSWRPIEGEVLVVEIAACCRRGEERDATMQAAIHAALDAFRVHDHWQP
ncbi:LysR family transcriptional regulator [Nocardia sp. NPDC059246]|uniref:LysR family transcriptional regulator n=1 Tax=unclassified Nocardia TaxID=2637762 RepID=UPI0036A4FC0F